MVQAKKAGLFYFVFVMYSYTTGGPFGIEGVVASSGPGMALIYDLTLPFMWCIPMSLVAAELTTAMPVEGGLPLGSRRLRRLLGIPGGLVELVCRFPTLQCLCRALCRLPGFLHPSEPRVEAYAGGGSADRHNYLRQHSRHSGGRTRRYSA